MKPNQINKLVNDALASLPPANPATKLDLMNVMSRVQELNQQVEKLHNDMSDLRQMRGVKRAESITEVRFLKLMKKLQAGTLAGMAKRK